MTSDAEARLATLEAREDLAAALADLPAEDRRGGGGLARVGALVIWVVACIVAAIGTALVLAPAALIPLALAGFGVYALVQTAREDAAWDRAPTRAVPAVAVAEETRMRGATKGGRSRARHVLVLATPEGRDAYTLDEALVGRVASGDAGVAYVKGGRLVAFRTLEPGPAATGSRA